MSDQVACRRATISSVGSEAIAAPLIAPTRADHEVGRDAALEQRAQHPDLAGPELSPAAEHERVHGTRTYCVGGGTQLDQRARAHARPRQLR